MTKQEIKDHAIKISPWVVAFALATVAWIFGAGVKSHQVDMNTETGKVMYIKVERLQKVVTAMDKKIDLLLQKSNIEIPKQ